MGKSIMGKDHKPERKEVVAFYDMLGAARHVTRGSDIEPLMKRFTNPGEISGTTAVTEEIKRFDEAINAYAAIRAAEEGCDVANCEFRERLAARLIRSVRQMSTGTMSR